MVGAFHEGLMARFEAEWSDKKAAMRKQVQDEHDGILCQKK